MKTMKNKSQWPLLLSFLALFSANTSKADSFDKLKKTLVNDFSGMEGFYIIGGLVVGSLLIYVIYNHFIKDKEDETSSKSTIKPGFNYKRHRHHHVKAAVKKTN
jgi:hypothetical protein